MKRLALGLSLAALMCAALPTLSQAGTINYNFQTINFPGDTFTQLLGINNSGTIAGYHGATINEGFTLTLPNNFVLEDFPNSTNTQVIGINNTGLTDGFYVSTAGVTNGFIYNGSTYTTADAPGTAFNQLLGINNQGTAAGYSSTDPTGATLQMAYVRASNGSYTYLNSLLPGGIGNSQATGVNNAGEISGFYLTDNGADSTGFLLDNGTLTNLLFPGSTFTQALGVNNNGETVGFYVDAQGNMHGFVYINGTYTEVNDPNGLDTTLVNGVNDLGQLVGFYVDANGNTDGFVASTTPEPATLFLFGAGLLGLGMFVRRKKLAASL
ncbi:MAG: PEP-CTERM sorting domain-containing protein [Terriglobia bacterium]